MVNGKTKTTQRNSETQSSQVSHANMQCQGFVLGTCESSGPETVPRRSSEAPGPEVVPAPCDQVSCSPSVRKMNRENSG